MVVQMVPERDFKRPGCGDSCRVVKALVPGVFGRSELLLHDPDAHELYGAASALQSGLVVSDVHTVTTGCLAVNVQTREARVDGDLVPLTPTEAAILTYLARRVGTLCPLDEIAAFVWPHVSLKSRPFHLLRVNMARMRRRLGPRAAGLVVTARFAGYFLDAVSPGELPRKRARLPQAVPEGKWARDWDACRHCGEATRPHLSRGFCSGWECQDARRALVETERQAEVTS